MFIEYLENWVSNNKEILLEKKLEVEHMINYDGKKVELGLSNTVNNNGGSLELIKDGTCDLMIIDYETDDTIFYKTIIFNTIDELSEALIDFINQLAQIKR